MVSLVVGFLTGFLGVGGGFIIVPALVLAMGFGMPTAVGTSLVIISITSLAALVERLGHGAIAWDVILPFTAAAIAGSLVGKRLSERVSPAVLTRAFAVLLVLVAGYVAVRAGAQLHGAGSGGPRPPPATPPARHAPSQPRYARRRDQREARGVRLLRAAVATLVVIAVGSSAHQAGGGPAPQAIPVLVLAVVVGPLVWVIVRSRASVPRMALATALGQAATHVLLAGMSSSPAGGAATWPTPARDPGTARGRDPAHGHLAPAWSTPWRTPSPRCSRRSS